MEVAHVRPIQMPGVRVHRRRVPAAGPGVLDVQDIVRDGDGRIVGLHVTFEQYCGSRPARPSTARTGTVRREIRFHR